MSDVDDDDIDAWLDSSSSSSDADADVDDVADDDAHEEDENAETDDDVRGEGDDGACVVDDDTGEEEETHDNEEGSEDEYHEDDDEKEEETRIATISEEREETPKDVGVGERVGRESPEPRVDASSATSASFGASFGSWASASFSLAKQTIDKATKSEVVSTFRRDLKELGAHVTGEDVLINSSTSPSRLTTVHSHAGDFDADGDDDGPSAADAVRLAETFASSAWAAFGGAARGAQKVLEKAENVIENAANDPRAFATDFKGKAQVLGGSAFNALTTVVKITTDALAGHERDGADEILLEKFIDFGADAHRAHIKSLAERAIESLLSGASENEQKTLRDNFRRVDAVLSGAATDPASPASGGASAAFVAVQLDVDANDSTIIPAEVLTSFIEGFDACARETSSTLAALAHKMKHERSEQSAILSALEDGLDELRDDFVCKSLAELTTAVLERVAKIVKAVIEDSEGGDAEWVASQTRARLIGMEDDIKVLVEAAKETSMNMGKCLEDLELQECEHVVRVAIDQLTRDESACSRIMSESRQQLAWIILASTRHSSSHET